MEETFETSQKEETTEDAENFDSSCHGAPEMIRLYSVALLLQRHAIISG